MLLKSMYMKLPIQEQRDGDGSQNSERGWQESADWGGHREPSGPTGGNVLCFDLGGGHSGCKKITGMHTGDGCSLLYTCYS